MNPLSNWLAAMPGTIYDYPARCLQTCMLSAQVCGFLLLSCNLIWWVTQALHCTAFVDLWQNPSRVTHMAPNLVGPHKVGCLNSQQESYQQTEVGTHYRAVCRAFLVMQLVKHVHCTSMQHMRASLHCRLHWSGSKTVLSATTVVQSPAPYFSMRMMTFMVPKMMVTSCSMSAWQVCMIWQLCCEGGRRQGNLQTISKQPAHATSCQSAAVA